jgi:hypothetical protein
MEKKAPRPQTTKELLIQEGLRSLEIKYRHRFASDVLLGRVRCPPHWLTTKQAQFVELDLKSTVDAPLRGSALDLTTKVVRLTGLVHRLIGDFTQRHQDSLSLDPKDRADLRRGRGPAAVREALFRRCGPWPQADPGRLPTAVRSEVDQVLRDLIQQGRRAATGDSREDAPATTEPCAGLPAFEGPRDRLQREVWHKTRATMSPEMLRRYNVYDTVRVGLALAALAFTGVLYLALFLGLRRFAADLTVQQAVMVLGSAVGGTGLATGTAAYVINARRKSGGDSGDGPPRQP